MVVILFDYIYQPHNLDLPTFMEPLDRISIRSKFLEMFGYTRNV